MLRNLTLSDTRLIRQVLGGRRQAFDVLVRRYLHVVHAVAFAQIGNHSDADDVTQETFIKAYQSLDTLRDPARFPAWLAAIARRVTYGILTKARRRKDLQHTEERAQVFIRTTVTPDVERREMEGLIRQHLDTLEPDYREALMLRYYAGRSVKDVAAILEISPEAAAKRLQRAREALGERLMGALSASQEPGKRKEQAQVLSITGAIAAVEAPWNATVAAATSVKGTTVAVPFLQGLIQAVGLKLVTGAVGIALVIIGSCLLTFWPPPENERPHTLAQAIQETEVEEKSARLAERQQEPEVAEPDAAQQKDETIAVETSPKQTDPVAPCITGRVYDFDTNQGVADVRIRAYSSSKDLPPGETRTDINGKYSIDGLGAGEYDVKVSDVEGYHWQQLEVPDKRVAVRADAPTTGIDFTVSKGITIHGKVLDESGAPVADVSVGGHTEGTSLSRSYSTTSGKDGTFELFGFVESNRFYVAASKKGYAAAPLGPLNLPIEGLRDVTLTLGPESSVEGLLVDGNGDPVQDVRILLWPEPSCWSTLAGFDTEPTNNRGEFRVGGLWPASYRVSIGLPGEDSYRRLENVAPIEVKRGEKVAGVTLVYEPEEGYTISGHVTDHRGQPVNHATVVATGASWSEASTDQFGFYCLSDIKKGSNELLVWHAKYCTASVSDVREGTEGADFALQPRGAVEGRVLDARTGKAIADFEVLERSRKTWWQDRPEYVRVQNNEGLFVLTDVEANEECMIVVRAEGYVPTPSQPFRVKAGETAGGIVVRLDAGTSLSGVVLTPDGEPVRNARLALGEFPTSRMSVEEFASAVTENDGTFRIPSLPVGKTTIHAHHPSYGPASATLQLDPDGTNHVELRLGRGAKLRGVARTQGEPIAALRITVGDVSPALYESVSNTEGSYTIAGLPPGPCTVVANPTFGEGDDWFGRKQIKTVDLIDGETVELNFDFDLWDTEACGTVTIEGKAPDPSHSMLHFVYADTGNGSDMFYTCVDKEGHYRLRGIRPGAAVMKFGRTELEVSIVDGQVNKLDFLGEPSE